MPKCWPAAPEGQKMLVFLGWSRQVGAWPEGPLATSLHLYEGSEPICVAQGWSIFAPIIIVDQSAVPQ